MKNVTYLYEINDNFLNRFDNQKYWISKYLKNSMSYFSDTVIELNADGSFFYAKNRKNNSCVVMSQDGSYGWITIQILSSRWVRGDESNKRKISWLE